MVVFHAIKHKRTPPACLKDQFCNLNGSLLSYFPEPEAALLWIEHTVEVEIGFCVRDIQESLVLE